MTTAHVDLPQLIGRLADRRAGRTEANVQSDLHMLLAVAPFELDDDDIEDITLEAPAGQRRRIDVEMGYTVFEVKRDLRVGNVRADAVDQLAGYVQSRTDTLQQRYVGVLTDGAEWHLYHLVGSQLQLAGSLEVNPTAPDVDGLVVWLESVLRTAQRITPTPLEIKRRLGATSVGHRLDVLELTELYQANRGHPEVKLKRELWSKLLTTALGTNFTDQDALFVEHTLLVATAEIIAHAVVGIDPTDDTISARSLLEGALFSVSQVGGVVESDFFDWVAEIPGGDQFVRALARNISRFDWADVEHDVMKILYESVISRETRHSLGEYYTPDWLAAEVVDDTVDNPLHQRVLDAACGSGTFLFHAVRRHLAAAEASGMSSPEALESVTRHVIGVDVHPVAVTFARVTYLLAIGMDRLQADDRPPISVPVYLGDSMQWGQEKTLFSDDGLTVPTDDGAQLFADELKFPDRLLADAPRFDRLVAELSTKATQRAPGSPVPSLSATFRLFAIHPDDQETVRRTFATMCRLNDEGRNHIWGYYVRNLARPIWLSLPANRVDVLVGNPPWLAYRFMPQDIRAKFRKMNEDRGMWAGASVATNQDLSGLFLVRAAELYLKDGGRFGLVMPRAVLSRRQYAGLRTGRFNTGGHSTMLRYAQPWDLDKVKPTFFPVPAAVLFGERGTGAVPLEQPAEQWAGRLPAANVSVETSRQYLSRRTPARSEAEHRPGSPYASRFIQGATVVPRVLHIVEEYTAPGKLGVGAGRVSVRSLRSAKEKEPWKSEQSRTGRVERQFVRPLLVGDSLLPYMIREPIRVVVPWDGDHLMDGNDDRLDFYPGLAAWWRQGEETWRARKGEGGMSLRDRFDYRRGISQQFPASPHRIVYSASGMYLAAARVSDPAAVVEHALYWGTAQSAEEARFLLAVLNSEAMTARVRPLQARGEHNPRHFDKYVWQVPVPVYRPEDERHQELASLAAQAEGMVAGLELPKVSFEALRRRVREALASSEVGQRIEELVVEVLR
ncbi:N-6 DNA methylase [Streptomyces massasporeus]|uniref:N-6 DNA methylase n=1 Tax=Streptomyces massasporeus TaxID=67324 RepID=UPI0036EF5FE2